MRRTNQLPIHTDMLIFTLFLAINHQLAGNSLNLPKYEHGDEQKRSSRTKKPIRRARYQWKILSSAMRFIFSLQKVSDNLILYGNAPILIRYGVIVSGGRYKHCSGENRRVRPCSSDKISRRHLKPNITSSFRINRPQVQQ